MGLKILKHAVIGGSLLSLAIFVLTATGGAFARENSHRVAMNANGENICKMTNQPVS